MTLMPLIAPTLRTARLVLRPLEASDRGAFMRILNDWNVAKNLGPVPFPYTEQDALDFLKQLQSRTGEGIGLTWAIQADGSYIGSIAVGPEDAGSELGYYLDAAYWNRGLMTEAGKSIVDFAFGALGYAWLSSGHVVDNPASGRVLKKLGFSVSGQSQRYFRPRDRMLKRVDYKLARNDWARGAP